MNNTIFFICSVIIFRTPTGHKWSSRQSSILSVVPRNAPEKSAPDSGHTVPIKSTHPECRKKPRVKKQIAETLRCRKKQDHASQTQKKNSGIIPA